MNRSLVSVLCVLTCHYFCLGISKQDPNIFTYPPDYVKADAPLNNHSGELLCVVNIDMELWAIDEISLQRQYLEVDLTLIIQWVDQRLTVNPNTSSHGLWPDLDKSELEQMWMPVIIFRNCKGCSPIDLTKGEDRYVNMSTGTIVSQIRLLRKFSCAIDLRAYPMDIQFCQIQLFTYQDTDDVIVFQHLYPDMEVKINSNLTLAEYHVAPVIKAKCVMEDSNGCVFSCLELRIRLTHLITYQLITAYAPTSFIVILSWISFWLPVNMAPARVALGLTSLLTLATRLDQAQKNLPPVAYAKAIDVWMFACIFLVSTSLCEFAVSHYHSELSDETPKVESIKIKIRPIPTKDNNKSESNDTAPDPQSRNLFRKCKGTSIDRTSRIAFPLAFLIFNIVYWSYYLTYYI